MNKNIIYGIFAIIIGIFSLARMLTRFTSAGKFKSLATGLGLTISGILLIYVGISEAKKEKSN